MCFFNNESTEERLERARRSMAKKVGLSYEDYNRLRNTGRRIREKEELERKKSGAES